MMDWVKSLQEQWGYPGVIFFMFLENLFPPIPSEIVMPLAGFMSSQGELSFAGVVASGVAGSVLGAIALYYIGVWIGQERICRWTEKHGKWIALSTDDLDRAQDWFERHGGKTVFLSRLVPGVRSLISIPAGFARMNLAPFLLYTTLGTAIWSAGLAYAGKALGDNYEKVEQYVGPIGSIVAAGLAIAFVVWLVRRKGWVRRHQDRRRGA